MSLAAGTSNYENPGSKHHGNDKVQFPAAAASVALPVGCWCSPCNKYILLKHTSLMSGLQTDQLEGKHLTWKLSHFQK